jgi:hypothetical protein
VTRLRQLMLKELERRHYFLVRCLLCPGLFQRLQEEEAQRGQLPALPCPDSVSARGTNTLRFANVFGNPTDAESGGNGRTQLAAFDGGPKVSFNVKACIKGYRFSVTVAGVTPSLVAV